MIRGMAATVAVWGNGGQKRSHRSLAASMLKKLIRLAWLCSDALWRGVLSYALKLSGVRLTLPC